MRNLKTLISRIEGWCTLHKAQVLYDLAAGEDCAIAVEIGIFGGKSLIPMAAAFADKGSGKVYGVEPWDNDVAVETITDPENDKWWRELDIVAIKSSFIKQMTKLKFEKYIKLLEIPSDAAVPIFQSPRFAGKIDLVHIDGAHSTEQAMFDVTYWLRLLRSGGHIVLDDINWTSVVPAYQYLTMTSELVYLSETEEDGFFSVFRKR